MRAWKKVHYGAKKTPKGFILECMTARYHNPHAKSWGEGVRDLFAAFCTAWPDPDSLTEIPKVPDISNVSYVQIPITKTLEQAKELISRFQRHKELADRALEEAKTDLDKSARTWRLMFGAGLHSPLFSAARGFGWGEWLQWLEERTGSYDRAAGDT